MDRRRFVQRYVERQRAYLPTYTAEHLANGRDAVPSKSLRSDGQFGFDTPVLRPRRVLGNKVVQPQLTVQAGRDTSRAHGSPRGEAPSKSRDPATGKKDRPRSKRKKASSPADTDNERAARLADRRERKRKKRAIVNPPQKRDDDNVSAAAQKRGRANGQKAKKPTALALLYGFSATNVTKDRLTLKPAPFLGVFSKGRASTKKKVTAAGKHPSRNAFFSESAFLNKPSEQVADHSNIDDDADDSSISDPKVVGATDRTTKGRGICTKVPAVKTPQPSTLPTTESEVWDIELQSKLPSSARDVSSEPATKDSAPVILDPRGAEWAASMDATEKHEGRRNEDQTTSLSVTRSRSRGRSVARDSSPAMLEEHDELHAVDVSSIHPFHSASQVGRRATDTRSLDLPMVASKYFTEPKPAAVQEFAAGNPQASRSNDDIDVLGFHTPGQVAEVAALDVETIRRVASPISVPQSTREFQTRCDVVPLEFSSDVSPYDDCYARVDIPCEPLGGTYHGYPESSVVEIQGDRSIGDTEYHHPYQDTTWDRYHIWCPSADLAYDGAENVPVEDFEGPYDPLAQEYEDDPENRESAVEPFFFETRDEYDWEEEHFSERWCCVAETGRDFSVHEDDGSICYSEESLRDGESEEVPGFSEGRALLLGVSEGPRCAGLSGLVQAEMDVARRLRDHWRPRQL